MEREGRVGTSDGNGKREERGEGQTSKKDVWSDATIHLLDI